MRKIVHLSDVHFGTADFAVAELVIKKINALGPDVVVVSGDLTQRARSVEFQQAKAFLERLPEPQIVIPGNHDIPLHNVFDRFFRPLDKFRRFITDDLRPVFIDDEIAIIGINTARSMTIKGGRINNDQIEDIRSKMCGLDKRMLKIVVSHHPFDLPKGADENDIVGRAEKAMPRISDCGGDVFLSGHLHVSNIETTAKRYKLENGRTALVIQAGTATSVRVRGEVNSFNVLVFEHPRLHVERLECRSLETGFVYAEHKIYRQTNEGWEQTDKNE